MPGSGKSYIGKKLADRLGFAFIELDSILEKEYHLPLQQILSTLGEKKFLEKQAEDVITYTQNKSGIVISPGGSIVYSENAMDHLKEISKIIYLEASLHLIKQRIAETQRGIVGLQGKTLEALFSERVVLYEHWASATIDADQDPEKIIEQICAHKEF